MQKPSLPVATVPSHAPREVQDQVAQQIQETIREIEAKRENLERDYQQSMDLCIVLVRLAWDPP